MADGIKYDGTNKKIIFTADKKEAAYVSSSGDLYVSGNLYINNQKVSTEADISASYVVIGTTASLPNERQLSASNGLLLTDNGAGSTVVLSAINASATDNGIITTGSQTLAGNKTLNATLSASIGQFGQITGSTGYFAGNVGIGTTSPVSKLTIEDGYMLQKASDTNSLALRSYPSTGTGKNRIIDLYDSSDTGNSGYVMFGIAPTSGWVTNTAGAFLLSSKNGTGTVQNLYICATYDFPYPDFTKGLTVQANTGYVGIGTTSPSYQLQLSTDSAAKPSTNTWTIASDNRLKENIQQYTKGLETLLQINPVTYDYNGKAGFEKIKNNVGIIAQDVLDILPDSISTFNSKLNDTDSEQTELYNFNSHALTYILINSVKQLKQQNDNLLSRLQALESILSSSK